ncbi:hypothetical protein C4J81_03355 [Deltaproteobacteria bacterium Smac51]|nr:hypothetical protein C4J81_03355 [Deltaproteobacteria bacterium Smac51]
MTDDVQQTRPEHNVNSIEDHRFVLNWPRWAARFLKLSSRLVKTRLVGYPDLLEVGPVIFAHWHSEDLSMLPHFGHSGANILVSASRDGSMLSQAVRVLGFQAARGSSSRGGMGGILALKKSLEAGQSVIFAADGPKGPRQVAKPGPIYLAAKTGCPIYPAGTACDKSYIFEKSWSKTRIPLPGAHLAMVFGEPLHIPPEGAKWNNREQSRIMTAAISDAVRAAQLELDQWLLEASSGNFEEAGSV